MTLDKLNLSTEYSNALKQILGNDGLSQNELHNIVDSCQRHI